MPARSLWASALLYISLATLQGSDAFVPNKRGFATRDPRRSSACCDVSRRSSRSALSMGLDPVTYLRTEWISAALCTNQTPRAADVCLQIGTQDGRAVTFIPRTIRNLVTSSVERDGETTRLAVSTRRQLKQQLERRGTDTRITYSDQPADSLAETEDESVDVVISLQAGMPMIENGLDWKRSVREAARVLKPGGRLLFVEQTDLQGESYLDYVENLFDISGQEVQNDEDGSEQVPIFDDVGWDEIEMILTPHLAGVAIKSMDAGLTPKEREQKLAAEEKDRVAEVAIEAYERGIKKRRRRKRKEKQNVEAED